MLISQGERGVNMSGKRRIKPEVELAIVDAYVSGKRPSCISEEFGVNRKTVVMLVRRNGCIVRDQRSASGRPMTDPNSYVERVLELREKGLSQEKIGAIIGFSQAVVSRVLRAAMVPTKMNARAGKDCNFWKGGKVINPHGYEMQLVPPDHKFASMRIRTGYIVTHRLVMAEHLGRALRPNETVHHINGDKLDNRLENLQLRQGRHGKGVVMVCACCGSKNIIEEELD